MRNEADLPAALLDRLPADAEVVAQAPGRANLIGEHTDYNEGFVLPVALELRTVVAGRRAARIRLRSDGRRDAVEVDPASGEGPTHGWGRYVTAIVRALLDDGRHPRGIDGIVVSTLPAEVGLSSSAALEVATALAILDEPIEPLTLAGACRRAENVHIGVQSGIMDPLAAISTASGAALLIDCRTLGSTVVPVPADLCLVLVDSGLPRRLVDTGYNRRRAECEIAARHLRLTSLRDASFELLEAADLPEPYAGRVRHVVSENARALAAADALRSDDRDALRRLFAASHASLAGDFAVSTPELDALVQIAGRVGGVIASRMTGAGFGGCIVSLVEADRAEAALANILGDYRRWSGRAARGWVSAPASGAIETAAGRATLRG